MTPTSNFIGFNQNETVSIRFKSRTILSRFVVFPRWYVCTPGEQPRILKNTDDEKLDFVSNFVTLEQYKSSIHVNDLSEPFTPAERFAKYNIVDFGFAPLRIIPDVKVYNFGVNKNFEVNFDNCLIVDNLALDENKLHQLKNILGINSTSNQYSSSQNLNNVITILNSKDSKANNLVQSEESYQININYNSKNIDITAFTKNLVFSMQYKH